MEKKVSVIIPVYNVEKYLRECLDSVVTQDLDDIEIICINDGSTDGSSRILAEYATQYEKLAILDKENSGLSAARNSGLSVAKGKYILFLDSDDLLSDSSAVSRLYDKAEHDGLDQLFFDATVIFESEETKEKNQNYIEYYKRKKEYPEIKTGKDFFSDLQENWDFKPNACMQMLRREFLLKYNLRFIEDIVHEDEVFTLECSTVSEKTGYLAESFLVRRIREESIMTMTRKTKSILGYYSGIDELIRFADKNVSSADERFYRSYLQRLQVMLELAARLYIKESEEEKEKLFSYMREKEGLRFRLDMAPFLKIEEIRLKNKKEKEDILKKASAREQEKDEEISRLKEECELLKKRVNEAEKKEERIRQSTSYKIGRAATYLPGKLKKKGKKAAESLKNRNVKDIRDIWLIGTPEFGNLGDHAISETEWEILLGMYPKERIHEVTMNDYWSVREKLEKEIKKADLLVFQGGGNIGNLWPKSEYIRRDAFDIWKMQKKVVMPQSIFFTEDEEGKKELELTKRAYAVPNLVLACRDETAYRFAKKNLSCRTIFTPDTVLFHDPRKRDVKIEKSSVVICLRNDKEKSIDARETGAVISMAKKYYKDIKRVDTVGEKQTRATRRKALEEFVTYISDAEIVITDRLHCMIFCALEGIPCIALDNSYGKLKGGYHWLSSLDHIVYIQDPKELEHVLNEPPLRAQQPYPVEKFRKSFAQLLNELSEK